MKNTAHLSSNGYVIHRGTHNGEPFVVIATGVKKRTQNRKTGDMVQIWILLENVHPVAGVQSGLDASTICEGCPFASGNGCYVNVVQAPAAVWHAYHRGAYPDIAPKDYKAVFADRKVRFGAYGNPTLIPLPMVKAIAGASDGWTGYFHNWADLNPRTARAYNRYFMASTETSDSRKIAEGMALRTFHVSPEKPEGYIECLSDSRGLTCEACLLCQGQAKPAKNIWISPHGSASKKASAIAV